MLNPSNWIVFFPIAMSLLIALRLARSYQDALRPGFGEQLIRSLAVMMFLSALFGIGMRANPLSIPWAFVLLSLGVFLFVKRRRLERAALLQTALLATTADQQQVVARSFSLYAAGWVRKRSSRILRDTARGVNWYEALENHQVARTSFERLRLRLQQRFGKADEQQLSERSTPMIQSSYIEAEFDRMLGRVTLFAWVLLLVPIVLILLTFIAPTFEAIFEEFGLATPAAFQLIVRITNEPLTPGLHTLVMMIPAVFLALAFLACMLWLFPSLFNLSILRWLILPYHESLGYVTLAKVYGHQPDLLVATNTTADLLPMDYMSNRYRLAAQAMQAGMAPVEAYRRQRLLRSSDTSHQLFAPEQSHLELGLQQFAAEKTERMLRRYSVALQIWFVVQTLLFALVVAVFAIGFFSCLVLMINSLS